MNYYEARPLKKEQGWHFTVTRDKVTRPTGFCVGCKPHPTEIEARRCYQRYLIHTGKSHLQAPAKLEPWSECVECGQRTPNMVRLGSYHELALCDAHLSEAMLEKHAPLPRYFFGSY